MMKGIEKKNGEKEKGDKFFYVENKSYIAL